MIYTHLTELIGKTPMLEIRGLSDQKARILVKIEFFNPGGSIKDRAALSMIEDAEQRGLIHAGATIIEPTSGNTGVGLAWIASIKGYHTILTMPDTMSIERRRLLQAYGAQLVLTPGAEGMNGAVKKAEELQKSTANSIILGQFDNPANPAIHERVTSEEIWADTEGNIDAIVAGVGTGGTISGITRRLRKHNPDILAFAVEPATSPLLTQGVAGKHGIQGIGANFIPENYDSKIINEVIDITNEDAYQGARILARNYGVLAGISSGASFMAAWQLAKRESMSGKTIVAILPDTGERYLSTGIFD